MKIEVYYEDNLVGNGSQYRSQKWRTKLSRELGPGENPETVSSALFKIAQAAVERERAAAALQSQQPSPPQQGVRQYPPTTQEPPQQQQVPPPQQGNQTDKRGYLERVSENLLQGKNGPFTSYGCLIDNQWINTIDKTLGQIALGLQGQKVVYTTKTNGKYTNLESIASA